MQSLTTLDTMANKLLLKIPDILVKGLEYGGDLTRRFLLYSNIEHGISILLKLSAILILIILRNFIIKKYTITTDSDGWSEKTDKSFIFWVSSIVIYGIILILLTAIINDIDSLILINYVPELYIINYFK